MNYQLSIINYPFLGVILLSLTLCACGASSPDLSAIHRDSKVTSSASGALLQTSTGSGIQYTSYAPEKMAGQRSVLFFAKDSDPFSKMSDQRLKTLYGSGAATISTYRVPFNESAVLQLKYGVFVEDTFVQVGTGAERLGLIIHPSDQELKELIMTRSRDAAADFRDGVAIRGDSASPQH